jgi:DNA helicase IV
MSAMTAEAIRHEQDYVDGLYTRVEELRDEVDEQLAQAPTGHGGSQQDLLDRDAQVARLAQRRVDLDRAEQGLCFGRLDRQDGSCAYIGRMGLWDEDLNPLLVDWRAPVASDFYTASRTPGCWPSGRRQTAAGPTATWSWTRPRS